MNEVKTLYVDAGEDGVRLDRWFKRRWPHVQPRARCQKLARSGQIRIDGGRTKADARLVAGSQVRVPPLPEAPPAGEKRILPDRDVAYAKSLVLYEDDEVLALNKPAGLAVQGGTKTHLHIDRLLSAWGEGLERPRLRIAPAGPRHLRGAACWARRRARRPSSPRPSAKRKRATRPTGRSSPVRRSRARG